MARRALLALLAVLLGLVAWITAADLIAHPRDRVSALLFAAGTLFGWALDHGRRQDR